jgi:hypothetical protein
MSGIVAMKLSSMMPQGLRPPVSKVSLILVLSICLCLAAGAQELSPAGNGIDTAESAESYSAAFDVDSFFGTAGEGDEAGISAGSENGLPRVEGGSPDSRATALFLPVSRQSSGLVLTGEASTDLAYSISEPFDSSTRSGSYNGASSLRLDAIGGDRNSAKIEASVIVRMMYGEAADRAREALADALIQDLDTSAGMVTALLLGSSGPIMTVDLKKLYLSVYMPMADISVGRMIVNYGRGTVFSPVDLFSAVDTGDIALGRTGNDALRVLFPLGNFSGLDLVSTIASSPEQSIAGGRLFGHALDWDFGLSAFRDGRSSSGGNGDLVFGLDLKGDIEFGVSAEALARLPFEAGSPDPSEAVYSLMAGLDYSIKGQWFFDLEYLWNIRAGQTYPVGGFRHDHNLFASLSWKPDDLTALDVRAIVVPAEALGQVSLGVSRSIAKGASLMGFAWFRNGNVENLMVPPMPGYDPDATVLSLGARLYVAY